MFDRPRLPAFTHSLQFRLLLLFLPVILLTVGFVALAAEKSASGSFRVYVSAKLQASLGVALTELDNYNAVAGKQADPGVEQAMVNQINSTYNVQVIVVGPGNQVIAASQSALIGSTVIIKDRSIVSDKPVSNDKNISDAASTVISCANLAVNSLVISTDATVLCSNVPDLPGTALNAPIEQNFLRSVNNSVLLSVFVAGLVALFITLVISHTIIKPIKRMTGIARHMEEGDLSKRLTIKTHTEIGELAHALNTMADSLQHSERLRCNMINDIAHELCTPLTNIRGYLEALQDQVVDPTPETIASLYEESTLLTRLVSDLQELSLAEAGRLCLFLQPVALTECILRAIHMLQLRADQKDIRLDVDLPSDLPLVEADPERVAQILRNLIANAIIHTPGGGCITVTATTQRNELTISVQDTGCGIAEQHLPYVFERFYRADPSRTRSTGGTGLGLAIVKQLVLAHRGQVSVASQPGCGSRFTFTLPIMSAEFV